MKNKIKFDNRKKRKKENLNGHQPIKAYEQAPKGTESAADEIAEQEQESTIMENNLSSVQKVEPPTEEKSEEKKSSERIFALDIGTRSVIGIVAEITDNDKMKILATTRREHKTRAMLDGQIHDVPEVAAIIGEVKEILEKETGELKNAAVAAAGRALYTMRGEAEVKANRIITKADEENLEFLGVQKAEENLQKLKTAKDSSNYYCVGYSVISYFLDDIPLKSLVGQRGNIAKVTVIGTFLPRQVIDSMQSALSEAKLNMRALTLEPIAAINVLIPPTMRHLNLALVDIGAGTSDVALTKDGSVFAYGMVPLAGDEITEALSQKFLLDFKVAEDIKRKASNGEGAEFSDILGANYNLTFEEIVEPIIPAVRSLAEAISQEIINLNNVSPQAVILVGGGALTPHLAEAVAEILNMPRDRVAVKRPEKVEGIENLPAELQTSDSVTPLGILKIASINTLHFLKVYVSGEEYNLFGFRELKVSDVLLNTGINLKKYNGKPGLALTVKVDGVTKFFPGGMGTLATVQLNGETVERDAAVKNGDKIEIICGNDGDVPTVFLKDVVTLSSDKTVHVNGKDVKIYSYYTVNGKKADLDMKLNDEDVVEKCEENTLMDVLKSENLSPNGVKINYNLNGNKSYFTLSAEILLNGKPANLAATVQEGDVIKYNYDERRTIKDVLDIGEHSLDMRIMFNNKECYIPVAGAELTVNGSPATYKTIITDGADIVYKEIPDAKTTVSDALLAVNFEPPPATSHMKFDILVNGKSAEFIDPIKSGDALEVVLTKIGEPFPVKKEAEPLPKKEEEKPKDLSPKSSTTKETPVSEIKDLADRAIPISNFKSQFKAVMQKKPEEQPKATLPPGVPNIPGLSEAIAASKK